MEVIYLLISYLLGSINFAYWIGRSLGVDISKFGDGNLGATNLYYALKNKGNKKALLFFILAAILDILKALLPTLLWGPLYGSISILGHCFSILSIIATKRVVAGVGFASTIGWALIVDWRLLLIAAIYTIPFFWLWFKDMFKEERAHVLTIYAMNLTALTYLLFVNPTKDLTWAIFIITLSVSTARLYRVYSFVKSVLRR